MTPIEWLEAHAPGFRELQQPEREAIEHFALLWSLFEANVLGNSASSRAIVEVTASWQGRIHADLIRPHLAYFSQRYFKDGSFTDHFRGPYGLNLRNNDEPKLVEAVLAGSVDDPYQVLAALLVIVYRLRNNLFHGMKWAYGLANQLGNFENANALLIIALDCHLHLG
jgi:hypothetical protein